MTPEALEKVICGTKEERTYLCSLSFGLFSLYYFQHYFKYSLADYHGDFINDIEELLYTGKSNSGINELLWITFREGAKTSFAKMALTWLICFKLREYPNIDSFDKENAERILFDVAFELTNNKRIRADFGLLFSKERGIEDVKQNRINNFITENGIRVEAHSTQESVRGRLHLNKRPDFLLIDDFENNKTKSSQAYTKQIRDHITEAMAGLAENGVILYLGNYTTEHGNVQWIIDRAKTNKKIRVRNIPIVIDGKPAWDSKYCLTDEESEKTGKKSIESMQKQFGSYVFSYEFMNQPVDDSMSEFKKDFIQHVQMEDVRNKETTCYVTIDPAISEKASADYTGITINFVDRENKWYLKTYRMKFNSKDIIDHLFYLHKTYKPNFIGMEEVAFTLAIQPFLEEEMRKQQLFFSVTPLKHRGINKAERIRGVIPRWDSRSIFLIGDNMELLDEMRTFPHGQHDDCIAEDSMVLTSRGEVKIQEVTTDDWVMTRGGYQRVLKVWDKGELPVITNIITGTPDHRVITTAGEKHLTNLNESDTLYIWNKTTSQIEKLSYIMAKDFIATQTQKGDSMPYIIGNMIAQINHPFRCIGKSGWTTLEKFLKDFTYTTKTKIPLIINWIISSLSQHLIMQNHTQTNQKDYKNKENLLLRIIKCYKRLQKNGDTAQKVKNGTGNILKRVSINRKSLIVLNVGKKEQDTQVMQDSVPRNVGQNTAQENLGEKTQTITKRRVYDLMIENHHEFFANGILVHNCLDSLSYQTHNAKAPHRKIYPIGTGGYKPETNSAI